MPRVVRSFDLFCGAGGSSCGAEAAGVRVVGGIDAWSVATDTFELNYPAAQVWTGLIENLTGKGVAEAAGRVDLLLASPECTNHTFAKGRRQNGEGPERSRKTANHVVRYAKAMQPRWLVVENVVSMRSWEEYPNWLRKLERIGFHLREITLDAQDFGVAQSRRRLFIVGDRRREPRVPDLFETTPRPAREILEKPGSNGYSYAMTPVFGHRPARAEDTKKRVRRAIAELGERKPFLVVYYGSDKAGGWQPLDRPLRTITTLDRFALVKPTRQGHVMRMLQPPELARAMGFPESYSWPAVSRRERIKLVGNAVSPPVMEAVVRALVWGDLDGAGRVNGDHKRKR